MGPVIGPAMPVETISEGEARFERARQRVGLVLAPLVFAALLLTPMAGLTPEAHRLAAVLGTVVTLWVTEALPLPVTALAGAAACVVLGVAPAREVFAPFADPLMFLFIGAFILSRAIFLHGLDRRFAFAVLSLPWVGARPTRILTVFGAVTAAMSAWISNTATTAMMFGIGLSIIAFLRDNERAGGSPINPRYATGMMLMTSFAASIGGLATPVGTPPNVIGLGFIRTAIGAEVSFFRWMLIGVPVVAVLFAVLAVYLNALSPAGVREVSGARELIQGERTRLGAWTRAQRSTAIAFGLTVVLWVVPGLVALLLGEGSAAYRALSRSIPEGVAAIVGALLLFLLPGEGDARAITWDEAVRIGWGVVVLSEATSNTAAANMVVPVVISIATAAGMDPFEPALGATMAASLGFMLPVSTPCNAIVYGSGLVPLGRMIRYGVMLDVAGIVVIIALVRLLSPLVR